MWNNPLIGQTVKFRSSAKTMLEEWHDENMFVVGYNYVKGAEEEASVLIRESKIDEYFESVHLYQYDDMFCSLEALIIKCTHLDFVIDYYAEGKLVHMTDTKTLGVITNRTGLASTGKYVKFSDVYSGLESLSAWHNLRPIK